MTPREFGSSKISRRKPPSFYKGRDKGTYRITADYQKGIYNLSKLDPSGQKTLLEKDRKKITAWICEQAGGIQEGDLSSLFLIDRLQFPSTASHGTGTDQAYIGRTWFPARRARLRKMWELSRHPIGAENEQAILTPELRAEKQTQMKEIQRKLEEMAKVEEDTAECLRDRISVSKRRLNQLRDLDNEATQFRKLKQKSTPLFPELKPFDPI
ncbi:MAG: hypothetical protein MPW15_21640 [Candidatus Manganitrophus sp.]|nr:hypothetical protein [Candidatus Manganitrophus sp.]